MTVAAIPNNSREILTRRGWTPYRLAKEWGKHANHVYTMVNRDNWPDGTDLRTVVEMASIIGCSVDELIATSGNS